MIALIATTERIKLAAVEALLREAGVQTELFDAAAGATWPAIIPMRLMIDEADRARARRALAAAGFREAADGDWDLDAPSGGP